MPVPAATPWPKPPRDARCPCLSGETYSACCGPLHWGEQAAPTATRLMRSRYTAFVVGEEQYLLDTWHPTTRPTLIGLDPAIRWMRLEILGATGGGLLDTEGTVEFAAHYRANGVSEQQREVSIFVKQAGRWLYVDEL